ncbi:hypothetical protein NM208_g6104 [Fusarium decemcellulare]|uniref:Uncharacterized protein n=1 Tax=Fusarium decemcellulare TaxID=57161 RepID=A0ACC1SEJ7_9HYPO|nr:hypothetical protein NM208_g6104 [Fusarium decemcellulare]
MRAHNTIRQEKYVREQATDNAADPGEGSPRLGQKKSRYAYRYEIEEEEGREVEDECRGRDRGEMRPEMQELASNDDTKKTPNTNETENRKHMFAPARLNGQTQ